MTTLDELSQSWNALRNAALGRGVELPPGMNSELADDVGTAFEQWRAWLAEQGPIDTAQREITLAGAAGEWADRYELLAAAVTKATGKKLPSAPSSPVEQALGQAGRAIRPWAVAVLFVAGLGLGVQLLRARR